MVLMNTYGIHRKHKSDRGVIGVGVSNTPLIELLLQNGAAM